VIGLPSVPKGGRVAVGEGRGVGVLTGGNAVAVTEMGEGVAVGDDFGLVGMQAVRRLKATHTKSDENFKNLFRRGG